jgi:hypothetical protein
LLITCFATQSLPQSHSLAGSEMLQKERSSTKSVMLNLPNAQMLFPLSFPCKQFLNKRKAQLAETTLLTSRVKTEKILFRMELERCRQRRRTVSAFAASPTGDDDFCTGELPGGPRGPFLLRCAAASVIPPFSAFASHLRMLSCACSGWRARIPRGIQPGLAGAVEMRSLTAFCLCEGGGCELIVCVFCVFCS